MGDSLFLAVLIGSTVGVAFILVMSISMKTILSPTDDQVIAAANSMPEVKMFFAQYPKGKADIDRSGAYGTLPLILYHYEKVYDDGVINVARLFVSLNTLTGMPSHIGINTDCGVTHVKGLGGNSYSEYGRSIVEILENTPCAK